MDVMEWHVMLDIMTISTFIEQQSNTKMVKNVSDWALHLGLI